MATRDELLRMGGVAEGGASSSPSVEELLKQGGTREEAPGALESFARGAYQGAGMGFADEQQGALEALGGHLKRTATNGWKHTGKGWVEDIKAEAGQVVDGYRHARDESRANYDDAERSNPTAYGVGQFGGAVATGLATGGASSLGRAGLKGALTSGALEGAASGLGGSGSDLTKADIKEYARAAGDTLKGGAYGAAGGGVGYGIGQGVKAVGRWGKGVLDRARGALRGEAVLAREAEEKLAQEAAQEAEVKLGKAHAQGLEMNAKVDRRQAQEAGRKAMQEAREKARLEKQAAREAEAPTQADPRIRAQEAADREAEKAAGARTQVDQRLRAQDRENIRAAREAEKQARQEAQAAQRRAEQLEKAQGQALQANKELDAARARRSAKEARQVQKEAEARALRAQRQAEALEKQHGQGLEMNKPKAQRGPAAQPGPPAGDVPEARGPRGRGEPKPDVDPETKVVKGYRDQAVGSRLTNEERVERFRQKLASGQGTSDQREAWEAYVEKFGRAVDDPHGFVRETIDRNMRLAKYPPGVVERVLRDRVGPKGEVYSRAQVAERAAPAPAPAAAVEEATEAMPLREIAEAVDENPALVLQRERGLGSQNMGAAKFGDETFAHANDDIRRAQAAGGDPFHDADTEFGLAYMGKSADEPGLIGGVDEYRFIDPKTNRPYELSAFSDPRDPAKVSVEYIGPQDVPADRAMGAGYGAERNQVGPGTLRKVFREMRAQYPEASQMKADRMTGWKPDREMDIPLAPVRQAETPTPPPTPSVTPDAPAVRDPFHDAQTQIALIELPRPDGVRPTYHEFEFRDPKTGREFTADLDYNPAYPDEIMFNGVKPKGFGELPSDYEAAHQVAANSMGPGMMKQLSQELARKFPMAKRLTGYRSTGANAGRMLDVRMPEVTQRLDASDLEAIAAKSENPALRRQRERGFGAHNMGAARFGEETIAFPNDDILRAQASRGGEATQVGPGPVTQAAAQREARGGEDLRRAFVRGAAGPDAAALGLGGIAVGGLAGGAGGVAAKGGAEVVKELARNPAARARAISAFRLNRLAEMRPEVYARVGGVLARAMERGPEHYAAKRHVLLLTDPELREAEAEADAELQGLSEEELAARVGRGAR